MSNLNHALNLGGFFLMEFKMLMIWISGDILLLCLPKAQQVAAVAQAPNQNIGPRTPKGRPKAPHEFVTGGRQ